MTYQYDAFFSYKRDVETDDWHERVKDKLAHWVRYELSKQNVQIFFDREDIRSGMRWRNRLADAIKHSRCIVCIWSPLYFQSKWCVSEWMSFVERGRQAERELVLPASFFDGETFPASATAIQFLDFSEFASTMPSFWDTKSAVRFEERRLRPFAKDLARIIQSAPPFNNDFPIVEVGDDLVVSESTIGRIANG